MTDASTVRVQVAGNVRVSAGAKRLDEAALPRRQGRLALVRLALHDGPVHKDVLAETLWPDGPPDTWDRTLAGVVSRLRAAFAAAGLDELTIASAFGCYQLQSAVGLSLDLDEARDLTDGAERALSAGDLASAAAGAAEAATGLRDNVLPGEEAEWLESVRRRQRSLLVRCLEIRAEATIGTTDAVDAASEAVEVDPFRETAHALLMRAHAEVGNTADGLRAYERCRRLLSEELGIDPSPATRELHAKLLRATQSWSQPALPGPIASLAGSVFVGRESALHTLEQTWVGIEGCSAVLVGGEPGVGKTHLAARFASTVHASGATVLFGRCDEDGGAPFQPFAEALRGLVATARAEVVASRGGRLVAELARLVPGLGDAIEGLPPPTSANPETERYVLFEAVTTLITAISQDAPLLLVLDDLQWADRSTVLMLRHLLRTEREARLLVLATYRSTELDRSPVDDLRAELAREKKLRIVDLDGLQPDDVAAYLSEAADVPLNDAARAFANSLQEETRGNAFFLREVVAHLIESEALPGRGAGALDTLVGLPRTVREVVHRRLARLPAETTETLAVAAVVGNEFALDLVERAAGATDRVGALEDAIASGLVTEVAKDRFSFIHAIVRRAIYEELSAARRRRTHLRIATAMASLPSSADDHEARAHHLLEAGSEASVAERAEAALTAGEKALVALASERAVAHLERGIALVEPEPDMHELSSRLHLALALAWWHHSEIDGRAAPHAQIAAEHARACGNAELFVEAVGVLGLEFANVDAQRVALTEEALAMGGPAPTAARATALADAAGLMFWSVRDRARARSLASEALSIARELEDARLVVNALGALAATFRGTPDVTTEDELLSEALAIEIPPSVRGMGRRGFAETGFYALPGLAAIVAGQRGDRARFDALCERFRVTAPTQAFGSAVLASARWILDGRFAEAEAQALRIFTGDADGDALQAGSQLFLIWRESGRQAEIYDLVVDAAARSPGVEVLRAAKTLCAAEAGLMDEASRELRALLRDDLAAVPDDAGVAATLCLLAEAAATLDDAKSAEALLGPVSMFSDLFVAFQAFVGFFGAADRFVAMLLTTLGRYDEAKPKFEAAIELEEGMKSPPLAAHSKLWFARMLLARGARGDVARARSMLRDVVGVCDELGMTWMAGQARELLAVR